jgi:DNA primase
MRVKGWTFPEAVRWLAEQSGIVTPPPSGGRTMSPRPPAARMPAKAPERPAAQSSGLPLADALAVVVDAEKRLWLPEGHAALEYLRGRGLTDAAIRKARLGWTPGVSIPVKDGTRY